MFSLLDCRSSELVGISPSLDENDIIITYITGEIRIYNVFEKRCLHSVQTALKTRLKLPAIQHPNRSLYFLDASNRIYCYHFADKDLGIHQFSKQNYHVSKPIQPNTNIFSLLVASGFSDLIVVFQSGELAVVDHKMCKDPIFLTIIRQSRDIEVIAAHFFVSSTHEGVHCVMVFIAFKTELNDIVFELVSVRMKSKNIEDESGSIPSYEVLFNFSSDPLVSNLQSKKHPFPKTCSSLSVDGDSSKVALFWSDGSLDLYTYRIVSPTKDHSGYLSLDKIFGHQVCVYSSVAVCDEMDTQLTSKRKRVKENSNLSFFRKSTVSICFFSSLYLGILGYNRENDSLQLSIWDTEFGILHSSQQIISEKCYFLQLIRNSHSHFVSIVLSNSIVICPIQIPETLSLATLMGKAHDTLPFVGSETRKNLIQSPFSSTVDLEMNPITSGICFFFELLLCLQYSLTPFRPKVGG